MINYIKNKNIEQNKVNNILDLSSVGETAWNFISALYKLEWDLSLIKITNFLDKRLCPNLLWKFKRSKMNPRAINKLTSKQALSNYLLQS